jgi:D-sedoheptulose 7-phosphate isomerase
MSPQDLITEQFLLSMQTKQDTLEQLSEQMIAASELLIRCLLSGNKILCCGNGGSASDAQHFSSEMLNRYEMNRPALPAIALTTDTATITSIANDSTFSQIFARQIKALGKANDILLVYTTSGNSENIIEAVQTAQQRDLSVIAFSGKDGGNLSEQLSDDDIELRVPSESTQRIQETHLLMTHCMCHLIDSQLFGQ